MYRGLYVLRVLCEHKQLKQSVKLINSLLIGDPHHLISSCLLNGLRLSYLSRATSDTSIIGSRDFQLALLLNTALIIQSLLLLHYLRDNLLVKLCWDLGSN